MPSAAGRPFDLRRAQFESKQAAPPSAVDPHHDATLGWRSNLDHAGVGEDAPAPDVQLAPCDLNARLCDHCVAFDRLGTPSSSELDGLLGECAADARVAERCPGDETRDHPHTIVGWVLPPLL